MIQEIERTAGNSLESLEKIRRLGPCANMNQKDTCIKELEKDLTSIAKWSIETNLVFNTGKTKFMLIASKQLSIRHKLKDEQLHICCNNTELERVTEWKPNENLTLNNHRSKILKDSYSHLSILKNLKRYT